MEINAPPSPLLLEEQVGVTGCRHLNAATGCMDRGFITGMRGGFKRKQRQVTCRDGCGSGRVNELGKLRLSFQAFVDGKPPNTRQGRVADDVGSYCRTTELDLQVLEMV